MSDLDNFLADECHRDVGFKLLWQDPDEDAAFRYGMALCLEREKGHLTVKDLAYRCGTTPQVIEDMEMDIRTAPQETLELALHVLQLAKQRVAVMASESNLQLARRLAPELSDRFKIAPRAASILK